MTTDPRTVIRDVLDAHRGRERGMVCDEGELWCDGCKAIVNADEISLHQATAILEALEQARTIETVEQLDALPQFSVIQFRGEALGESHQVVWQLDGAWFPAGSGEYNPSRDFPTEAFPAAVLWLPEWGNK